MKYLLLLIVAPLLIISGVQASEPQASESQADKYQTCMGLVGSDAAAAVRYAEDWIFGAVSGGVPAGHCKALGLLGLGKAKEAARLLEKLVEDMVLTGKADPASGMKNAHLKVQLHAQAAQAWKEAGDFDKSYVAYSAALSGIQTGGFNQNDSLFHELYLARGTLQILRGQYKSAIEDFTLALEKDSRQFEGFLQRAKAYRKSRAYLKARMDLRVADSLAPNHPGILLESGILYREQGQNLEARRVWQKIIDRAADSDYADLARQNIDLLKLSL